MWMQDDHHMILSFEQKPTMTFINVKLIELENFVLILHKTTN